ncbi:hypothetical protein NPIL_370981 [Nephila pilipes]|uniref:Uncharacterized protein n=1 Tax=Nephila pilipes TaxID=299642 RepID=A0A8X6UI02_NEPPI|nr:hypothetical protein NPIL_370981 [Nephila pilipes]
MQVSEKRFTSPQVKKLRFRTSRIPAADFPFDPDMSLTFPRGNSSASTSNILAHEASVLKKDGAFRLSPFSRQIRPIGVYIEVTRSPTLRFREETNEAVRMLEPSPGNLQLLSLELCCALTTGAVCLFRNYSEKYLSSFNC